MNFSKYALQIIADDAGLTKDAPKGDRYWVESVMTGELVGVMVKQGNAFALARQLGADTKSSYKVTKMVAVK